MAYNYSIFNGSHPDFKDIYLFCGKSAYQEYVDKYGYEGTEEEWLLSLRDLRFGVKEDNDFTDNDPSLIYIDTNTNYIYRYVQDEDRYQPIGGVLGETSETAFRGDYGKIAYDHANSDHDFIHRTNDSTVDGIKTFVNTIVGNIDTATKLHTGRDITVGECTKNFDGTANISFTLDEIGVLNENDVRRMFSELIDSAPETLDTFKEIANALGNDPNFSTTVFTELGKKLPLAGGIMTGTISSQDIIPKTANTYDLGSMTSPWKSIYSNSFQVFNSSGVCVAEFAGDNSGSLILGNNGSVPGMLNIYQSGAYYTRVSATAGSANYNILLPAASGTLSLEGHIHSYAGSASAGGAANSANFLNVNSQLTYGASGLNFFDISTATTSGAGVNAVPTANKYYYIFRMNHGNKDGYFADLAVPLNHGAAMAYRVIYGGSEGIPWRTLLDSSNYKTYCTAANLGLAPASHSHSYLALTGGTVTGALTVNGSISGKGGFELYGATPYIDFHFNNSTADYTTRIIESASGALTCTGTFKASKAYNAVFNDYAEWYEKQDVNESFEPGDILIWDETGVTKSTNYADTRVVGVYSDSYAQVIGGEDLDDMEKNIDRYLPVGLNGRVKVKVKGLVKPGDLITTSDEPGVGIAVNRNNYQVGTIIGKALQIKRSEGIDRVKIQIMLG